MNTIINFHVVNDPFWFENVLCLLKSKYRFVSLDTVYDYYQGNLHLQHACHITVDDGDISFYRNIFPILKKHRVPATLFVSPGICLQQSNFWFQEVNGYDPFKLKRIIAHKMRKPVTSLMSYPVESILKLFKVADIHEIIKMYQAETRTLRKRFQNISADRVLEMDNTGLITIGAHTMNHPILKNESDLVSRYEITESVQALSKLLNRHVRYFAYPNGIPEVDFSAREEHYLKEAGIHLAFTTASRNFSNADNPMRIPRIGISDHEHPSLIKMKFLTGTYWEVLRGLKPSSERQQRKQLAHFFEH